MRQCLVAFAMVSLVSGCDTTAVYDIAFIGQISNPDHLRGRDSKRC